MNILFIHQNFPAQFKSLAPALAALGHEVRVLVQKKSLSSELKGITQIVYEVKKKSTPEVHPWLISFESQIIRGEAVFHAAQKMKAEGYRPDAIITHPGWGESMFVKDVWPAVKLGIYCEFYYQAQGADLDFDPEFSENDEADVCRMRLKNLNNMLHFPVADAGIAPTYWQALTFPRSFHKKISVIHDGIDTRKITPYAAANLQIKTAAEILILKKSDEIITFVNRNLEPYRGFHIFMRALPNLLKRRPNARVLIVGGSGVSYGPKPKEGGSWREVLTEEVRGKISDADWSRVHFMGNIAYNHFIPLLQVSTVHLYFTYPFVLSWSLLEAMSAGCAIIASNTKPVQEVIKHDVTGRLVDFFDVPGLVNEVCTLLDDPASRARLGSEARAYAVANYDLQTICLPRQIAWINKLCAQHNPVP